MKAPFVEPEIVESGPNTGRWAVMIFNNEYNTVLEIIEVLMRSTGCTPHEAFTEMWEAHNFGKAFVHFAEKNECEIVAAMIASIGCRTLVRPEWED